MKRHILSSTAILFALFLIASCSGELTEQEIIEKAAKIHDQVLTIDTHNDTPMRFRSDYRGKS